MKKILIITLFLLIVLGGGGIIYWKLRNTPPSITLLSPNGGEVIKEGSVYTIKWETKNIPASNKISINIRRIPPPPLQQEGQEFDPIIFVNLENTGSVKWTVSDTYPEGSYVLGITSYASVPITNPISDESDAPFRIVKEESGLGQVYTNQKFGYSINYPSGWFAREFPDTQSGAGFRPSGSADSIASECITVDERGTAANEYNTPFNEYVKKAAAIEIQNYEKLNSIKTVTTTDGVVGYETTWVYRTLSGQEKISLPITYFENKKIIQEGGGQLRYKTIQVVLESNDCKETYDQMLATVQVH